MNTKLIFLFLFFIEITSTYIYSAYAQSVFNTFDKFGVREGQKNKSSDLPPQRNTVPLPLHKTAVNVDVAIEVHNIRNLELQASKGVLNAPLYFSARSPLNRKLVITSAFGTRTHPISKGIKFHAGIDLRANYEPVYAVFPGVVAKAGWGDREGLYIVLKHSENAKTIYCHLSELLVRKGEWVYAGKQIGVSGNTGSSTAPHLHFGIKFGRKYLNPAYLLKIHFK